MIDKSYKKYLNSKEWKKRRKEVLEKKGNVCFVCRKDKKSLNVHHNQYTDSKGKTILGKERHKYLIPLCYSCHFLWHKYHGMRPITMTMVRRMGKMRAIGIKVDDCIRFCYNKYLYKHIMINWKKDKKQISRNKADNSAIVANKGKVSAIDGARVD